MSHNTDKRPRFDVLEMTLVWGLFTMALTGWWFYQSVNLTLSRAPTTQECASTCPVAP